MIGFGTQDIERKRYKAWQKSSEVLLQTHGRMPDDPACTATRWSGSH